MDNSEKGFYARKQLHGKNSLISFSHKGRFKAALKYIGTNSIGPILDYGCGDGTFLRMLASNCSGVERFMGAEISIELVEECRQRSADYSGLIFETVESLRKSTWRGQVGTIICMEVLEHVVEPNKTFEHFDELLSPGGKLIISVPIETGPVLILKNVVRHMAKWQGMKDYPGNAPYTPGEFLRSVFAGSTQHIKRPIHARGNSTGWHCHKGFNWKLLRAEMEERYDDVRIRTSPFNLGPWCSSQVWMEAQLGK